MSCLFKLRKLVERFPKISKSDEDVCLKENKIFKGGRNRKPSIPRPAAPKGQSNNS